MTLFHHLGIVAASGGVAAAPGMVLLTPSSITHSGTSASIGANGQVTFTAVTSLSLNGVFSADFDNYVVSFSHLQNGSSGDGIRYRMRAAGTDDTTAGNYVSQFIAANSTTVSAARITSSSDNGLLARGSDTARSGDTISFYGPFLAQPTAVRSVNVTGQSSAYLQDNASTHSLSTSYDGFTIFTRSGSPTLDLTGKLTVYGVRS